MGFCQRMTYPARFPNGMWVWNSSWQGGGRPSTWMRQLSARPRPRLPLSLCSRLSFWGFGDIYDLRLRKVRECRERCPGAWRPPSWNCWDCRCLIAVPRVFSGAIFDVWAGTLDAVSMWLRAYLESCLEPNSRSTTCYLGKLLKCSHGDFLTRMVR